MKENLRNACDSELSLQVFNTEHLYKIRHSRLRLMTYIRENYLYTKKQLQELKDDLEYDEILTRIYG